MKKETNIRILVADDHYVVRMGVIAMINDEDDMDVVAEAANGIQAIELFKKHRPDLALLDSRMPLRSGIQAAKEIRGLATAARIVMLTAFEGDEDIFQALDAGAQGYVLKHSTDKDLIPAIRAVAAGEDWIPREVEERLASRKTYEPLTPRELVVLHEMAKGLANKQIASVLNITQNTAKGYLKNILYKLKAADRTEAVTVAIQRGLIHL
ncbi:MAG TPA: response regulator transcription factor [Candidatus Sulfotelmatobacter sp.]|nr:response regulator transcription factor [Candidatus Sulfotelmatobacter sp.]